MQVFIYDGKTGEKLGSLGGDTAHAGGIYAVSSFLSCSIPFNFSPLLQLSWGPDSERVLTASGDKTCKLWDVQASQVVTSVCHCVCYCVILCTLTYTQ